MIALSPGDLEARPRERFLADLEAALAAGLPALLLREPRLDERAFLELAGHVRARMQAAGSPWFAVHDRAHLALELGADAVHLSFRSLRPPELVPWIGARLAIGLSTHADDDPATWHGADYLFHGPLRDTPSKRGRLAPIGIEGLERALARTSIPILALGGVRPADVAPVLAAGAHGVAVLGGIFAAADAAAATRAYLARLAEAKVERPAG
ncbi:MAG TPA: thiamine phosphate synthase [Myxococcota bacterium]|nr:thiamine phosphate synthase [Myxococcota bacterium]